MPCCCINILNLCDKPVCGVLTIDKIATGLESGDENNYTLVVDYFENQITFSEEQTEGENIHFDISGLNENFQYTGKIYDSSGNLVTITQDGIDYDCIKFKTIIQIIAVAGQSDEIITSETTTAYKKVDEDNYTALSSDYVISVNNGNNDWTINLPSPVGIIGKTYIIKRYDNSSIFNVIVSTTGGLIQDINGIFQASTTLQGWGNLGHLKMFMSNGTNWEYIK